MSAIHLPTSKFSPETIARDAALAAGHGALTAGLCTSVSLLGGAVFGATYVGVVNLTAWAQDKIKLPDTPLFKTIKAALPIIMGIGIAFLTTFLAGFPITFLATILLSVGIYAMPYAIVWAAALEPVKDKGNEGMMPPVDPNILHPSARPVPSAPLEEKSEVVHACGSHPATGAPIKV